MEKKLYWKHCWTLWFYDRCWHCNCCMEASGHSQHASLLPRLRGRIPRQDVAKAVVTTWGSWPPTTGDKNDVVNRSSSQSSPWRRKLAATGLPPFQLSATSVNGHLVVGSFSCEGKILLNVLSLSASLWDYKHRKVLYTSPHPELSNPIHPSNPPTQSTTVLHPSETAFLQHTHIYHIILQTDLSAREVVTIPSSPSNSSSN